MLIVAIALIFIGMLLMVLGSFSGLNGAGGAVILIGPIPIVMGFSPESSFLLVVVALAVLLTIASLIVFLLMRRRMIG